MGTRPRTARAAFSSLCLPHPPMGVTGIPGSLHQGRAGGAPAMGQSEAEPDREEYHPWSNNGKGGGGHAPGAQGFVRTSLSTHPLGTYRIGRGALIGSEPFQGLQEDQGSRAMRSRAELHYCLGSCVGPRVNRRQW